MVRAMTDTAALRALEKRIDDAASLHHGLVPCFNALAENRYTDLRLQRLVNATLNAHGLHAALPLQQILDSIEPIHTGMVVEEARLMTQASEEAQLRMRLLLRSPRAVYGLSELGDDDLFAPYAPIVAGEITRLHAAEVPYMHQVAANFLKAAESYPSAPALKPVIDGIEARRGQVALEYVKLQNGMNQGAMSIGELDTFYRPYTDMTYHPARDYAENTLRLSETHLQIAETNMARIGLRITQSYLTLTSGAGRHALATDPVFKADFDTKFQETANAFQRNDLHLEFGTVTDGAVYGARAYLKLAQAYKIA